jgi:siroheme synthase
MKKLASLFSTFFLLVCAGCATNDRIIINSTGEITLNSKVKRIDEIVDLLGSNQLSGQTPVLILQEGGNSRQSTVDGIIADIFQASNEKSFPEERVVESPGDPFSVN